MYNRYQGNSGRVERVPDAPQPEIRPHPPAPSGGNNKPPPGLPGEYAETIPIPVPCGVCPCRWSTCTMNLPFAGCVRPEVLRRMPRP